ncbi:MAG: S8 family serine peptidase, partial [Verrucomicrobiales bacterium]|nr:S8 family serine peptidase [Verrucomicrobiales bacterium]
MGTDSTARNNVRLWWQLFGSELTSADSPPNPFTDSDGDGTPDLAEAILFTDPLTAPDTTPAPERAARHAAHQQRRRQLQSRRSRDLKPLRDLANKTRRTFPGGHASYKEWHLTQRAAVRHFAAQPTIPYQEQRRALEQFARQRGATVNPGDGSRELHELTFLDGFGFPLEMEVKGDWADTFIPESHPIDGMFPFPIGMWEVNGYPLEDHIEFVGPYGGTEPRINPESPSVSSRALLAGALCFDDTSLLPGETVPSGALLCPTYSDPNFPGEVFPGRLPPFAYDSHATGVANVLIGVGYDTPARGVAYKGSLHAYHSDWDILTMYQAAAGLTLQYDGLDPNSPATPLLPHILVSNHSYANTTRWHRQVVAGIPAGWSCYGSSTATIDGDFGTYAKITQDTDELVYHFRHYLPVWGAGNDRSGMTAPGPPIHDDGVNPPYRDPYTIFETGTTSTLDRQPDDWNDGWGTLPNTATAKNTLVVGAVYGIASKPLASYSSCGPTFDRRIKPDLVAVGSGVYSAKAKPSGDYIESGQPFNRLPAI